MTNFKIWLAEQIKPRAMLLVDDSKADCELIHECTKAFHCEWSVANCADDAMKIVESNPSRFTLIFLDLKLESIRGGIGAFREFKERWPKIPVVILSGHLDSDAIHEITTIGFAMFANKPACFTSSYFEEMFRVINVPERPASVQPDGTPARR